MRIRIEADDPRPMYEQIMSEVRRAVVLGVVRAEDPLPSVRRLAADLRINPNTVQQAYRELERAGVIYVRRGRGTFVSPDARPTSADLEALADEVALRALGDADRHGLTAEELIVAIRRVAEEAAPSLDSGEEELAV